ncbi:Uncharacterised protein [Pseudomonas fluorescens]|nr:Uncharacterised protein [Pseudomonas fluorescens]
MTKKRITLEQVELLRMKLQELPPVNVTECIGYAMDDSKMISEAITQLQARSYSLEQISEILKGNRMDLTPKSLRDYLSDI